MRGECHRAEGQENTKNKKKRIERESEGWWWWMLARMMTEEGEKRNRRKRRTKKGRDMERVEGGHESPVSLQESWKLYI